MWKINDKYKGMLGCRFRIVCRRIIEGNVPYSLLVYYNQQTNKFKISSICQFSIHQGCVWNILLNLFLNRLGCHKI